MYSLPKRSPQGANHANMGLKTLVVAELVARGPFKSLAGGRPVSTCGQTMRGLRGGRGGTRGGRECGAALRVIHGAVVCSVDPEPVTRAGADESCRVGLRDEGQLCQLDQPLSTNNADRSGSRGR